MTKLEERLREVPDSYHGFVVAALTYVNGDRLRYGRVSTFMDNNPKALSSDILDFISDQDDFYKDAAPAVTPMDHDIDK